jgi:hypothetical protein
MGGQEAGAEQQIGLGIEIHRMPPVERDPPRLADRVSSPSTASGSIVSGVSREAQQDGTVAMVTAPGQRQRAEQLGLHPHRDQPGVQHRPQRPWRRASARPCASWRGRYRS